MIEISTEAKMLLMNNRTTLFKADLILADGESACGKNLSEHDNDLERVDYIKSGTQYLPFDDGSDITGIPIPLFNNYRYVIVSADIKFSEISVENNRFYIGPSFHRPNGDFYYSFDSSKYVEAPISDEYARYTFVYDKITWGKTVEDQISDLVNISARFETSCDIKASFKNVMFELSNIETPSEYVDSFIKNGGSYADLGYMSLTGDDVMANTITYTDNTSSSGNFDIGASIINSLSLTLNNYDDRFSHIDFSGASLRAYIGIPLAETEWITKGYYTVDKPTSIGNTIPLTMLDNMSKFEKPYSLVTQIYPATLASILQTICVYCGVVLDSTTFPNSDFMVTTRPDDENLTCLAMVGYIAQISGCYARINQLGYLQLKWYDENAFSSADTDYDGGDFTYSNSDNSLDGGDFTYSNGDDIVDGGGFAYGNYFACHAISSFSVGTDDITVTGIRVVVDTDNEIAVGSDGYVLEISDNPLITADNMSEIANYLGNKIVGLTFRPFNISALSEPSVEAGDAIKIIDQKGNSYKSFITSCGYKYGNYEPFACNAQTASKNGATSYSAITKAVVKARKDTEKVLTEYDKAVVGMNEIALNALGYHSSYSEELDGSRISYIHDKPLRENSTIIWKLSTSGFFLSQDGGATFSSGWDANGNAVFNILYAIGIVCDWIKGGTLTLGGSDNVNGLVELYDGGQKRIDTNTITNVGSIGDTATLGYHSADGTQLAYTFTKSTETSYENRTIAGYTTTELATSIATVLSEVCKGILDVTSSGNVVTTSQVKPGVGMVWFVLNGMSATGTNIQVAVLPKLIVKLDKSGIDINNGAINLGGGVFRVNADGSMKATNADITGKITSSSGSIGGFDISSNTLSSYGHGMIGVKLETNTGKVNWSWNNSEGSYSSFRSCSSPEMPPNMVFWAGGANGHEGIYVTNSAYTEWGGMSSWIRHGSQQIKSNDKGYVTWSGGSDARIKRDVVALENIQTRIFFEKVEPKIFKYTEEYRKGDDKTYFGVIAQDMEKIFDDLEVPTNNIVMETDDSWKFVNYQEFHAFELAGIKDLYETIDKQQAEIDELKAQMKSVLERLGDA